MRAFLAIRRGMLVAEVRDDSKKVLKYAYTADRAGARKLASMIARNKIEDVSYSSSIDFPVEDGGTDLDFRTLIEAAHLLILNKRREKILEAFLSFYRKGGQEKKWTIIKNVSQHLSVSEMIACMESSKKGKKP